MLHNLNQNYGVVLLLCKTDLCIDCVGKETDERNLSIKIRAFIF